MKSLTLTLAVVFLTSLVSQAQEKEKKDLIKLVDGSVFYGSIEDNVIEEYIIVELIDWQKIRIPYDKILALKQGKFKYKAYHKVHQGYFNFTSVGLIFHRINGNSGLGGYGTIQTINGYVFDQYLRVGLGVGYDKYPSIHTIPVFANLQGDIFNNNITPTYTLGMGYGFTIQQNAEFNNIERLRGGLFVQSGLGIAFHGIKSSFIIGVDYKVQMANIDYRDWWWGGQIIEDRTFKNVAVKIAMMF